MSWLRHPFSSQPVPPPPPGPGGVPDAAHPQLATAAAAAAVEDETVQQPGLLAPSTKLTRHQFFYIFVLDGLGAMVISGAINFGIACAMYTTQDPRTRPIRLFRLPNTLAGDAAVTVLLQCGITWAIELLLATHDLRRRAVQPIGFVARPGSPSRLLRGLLALPAAAAPSSAPGADAEAATTTTTTTAAAVSWSARRWLGLFAAQMLALVVPSFFVFWAPAVGIMTAVGRRGDGDGDWDWYFEREWAPEVFKLVFGGVVALGTTPLMVAFWLVRAGWEEGRGGERGSSGSRGGGAEAVDGGDAADVVAGR